MASSKDYLAFLLEQFPDDGSVTYKPMMGEFLLYYRGKLFGGIYDDRFLVKPTKAALAALPDAKRELPYPGAKEMLLVEEIDDRDSLAELLKAIGDE